MKLSLALVGALVATAVVIGASTSCSIDRPSEALKCEAQTDCTQFPGTICSMGYCVRGMLQPDARELDAFVCPPECNGGCDTSQAIAVCNITGTGSGNITCPDGMRCVIGCPTPGACNAITCSNAASCDIDCLVGGACLGITCNTATCDVTCTGTNACGNIACTSGDCTRTCSGADACGSLSCTTGNCTSTCSGGSDNQVCGNQTCSSGDCTRTCTGANACGTMTCNGGDCTQTCSGGMSACDNLNCGAGKCLATCMGIEGACGNVACGNSCQCDVNCDLAGNQCPSNMTCPDPNGGQVDECEDLTTGRCDSSKTPQRCQECP